MASGKVKWFNNSKGYGFILPEHGGEDLFAHYSTIQMDGYKTLRAGQEVVFDVEAGPKGLHAINIRATEPDGARSANVGTAAGIAATNGAGLPTANGAAIADGFVNGSRASHAKNGYGEGLRSVETSRI